MRFIGMQDAVESVRPKSPLLIVVLAFAIAMASVFILAAVVDDQGETGCGGG